MVYGGKMTKLAPVMNVTYSTFARIFDEEKLRVYGHESRCKALLYYWEQAYQIDSSLPEIVVIDVSGNPMRVSLSQWKEPVERIPDCFYVEITDTEALATLPDLVINYQVGAENKFDYAGDSLLGKEYFFFDSEGWERRPLALKDDEPLVIVIPNSNQNFFFKEFDLQAAHKVVRECGAGGMTVVNRLDKNTLRRHIDSSAVVITTPSVTAMECLSMGTPTLLVQTSPDQTGEFERNQLAFPYSPETLRLLLTSRATRMALGDNARANIKNNIEATASEILDAYTKWYAKGTGLHDEQD
jgi:hypothetical protein